MRNGGEAFKVEGAIHSGAVQIRDEEMQQPFEIVSPASNSEGYSTPRSSKSPRLDLDSSPRSNTRGSAHLITADLTGLRELNSVADGQGMGNPPVSMTAAEHPSETVMSEGADGDDVEEKRGRPRKTPNSPVRGGDVEAEMRNREETERQNEETRRVFTKFKEGAGMCMCLVRGAQCQSPGPENLVAEGSISASSK